MARLPAERRGQRPEEKAALSLEAKSPERTLAATAAECRAMFFKLLAALAILCLVFATVTMLTREPAADRSAVAYP